LPDGIAAVVKLDPARAGLDSALDLALWRERGDFDRIFGRLIGRRLGIISAHTTFLAHEPF
jgi:hypothetical protein